MATIEPPRAHEPKGEGEVQGEGDGRSTTSSHRQELLQESTIHSDGDVEQAHKEEEKPDIEHEPVADDPRLWSPAFKWTLVAMLSFGALIPTMAANIFFPVINDLKADLRASQGAIALSISLYILAQGGLPLVWSPLSEIIGRKICFLCALTIFSVTSIVIAAATQNVATLIALRVIGAGGSSAMLSISAGTLADLYEPAERGVKVGIYYSCPLIGPALGPIFGGAFGVTGRGAWRLTFYFMGACGFASFLTFFFFFKETFRTERSLAWQKAKNLALAKAEKGDLNEEGSVGRWAALKRATRERLNVIKGKVVSLFKRREDVTSSSEKEVAPQESASRPFVPPVYEETTDGAEVDKTCSLPAPAVSRSGRPLARASTARPGQSKGIIRRVTTGRSINRTVTAQGREIKFRPALSDVSPVGSAIAVIKRPHNIIALLYSGTGFASQYSLSYTATRTFSAAPYNFSPILIGVVLLALGIGGMAGSILGGRLSDRALRIGAEKNGGVKPAPELRIMSVRLPMLLCPPTFVGYAWSAHYKTHIAIPIVCLVLLGFSLFWIYSSTLSYLIDSNVGRSSGAVACNSATRGLLAFVASEVAGPLQDAIGDGPLYTGWAVLLTIGQIALLVVAYKGEAWRDPSWQWPRLPLLCGSRGKEKKKEQEEETAAVTEGT